MVAAYSSTQRLPPAIDGACVNRSASMSATENAGKLNSHAAGANSSDNTAWTCAASRKMLSQPATYWVSKPRAISDSTAPTANSAAARCMMRARRACVSLPLSRVHSAMNSTSAVLNVDGSLRGSAGLPALSRRIIPALAHLLHGTDSVSDHARPLARRRDVALAGTGALKSAPYPASPRYAERCPIYNWSLNNQRRTDRHSGRPDDQKTDA
jgi:hypothetical protein